VPVLGATLSILNNALDYTRQQAARHGQVFQTRFMGRRAVVLLGAEAHKRVLGASSAETLYSSYGGYQFLLPFIGGGSLLTLDGAAHDAQRKVVAPAFHSRHYGDYMARITRSVASVCDTWNSPTTTVEAAGAAPRVFYKDAREMTFRMACSLVLGLELGPSYSQLSADWNQLFSGIVDPIRANLPFTPYGRSMAAKRRVDAFLRQLVSERRAAPGTDLVSLLLDAHHEDGTPLSEDELVDQARLLLFAAFDTTASTMTWLLVELLRNPEAYARVEAEVGAAEGRHDISPSDLAHLSWLDACIKETLRLHPATAFLARSLTAPMEYSGYTIPAGWLMLLMLAYTHRMPEYFDAPDTFDPERFLPPREEDKRTPYAWVGFGSGAHTCLGMGIAQVELKTALWYLVQRYTFQLVPDQDLRTIHVPINRPKSGLLLTIHPRAIS
jgi:cytochrome P450